MLHGQCGMKGDVMAKRPTKPAAAGKPALKARGGRPAAPALRPRGPSWVVIAAVVAIVALAGSIGAYLATRPTSAGTGSAPQGVQTFPNLSRDHVQTAVTYPQIPPVGGPHSPLPLNCGVYPNPVPNENAVHSLEHGAVWITYQPTLSGGEISTLHQLVGTSKYVILSPYPGLPSPVVASAWGIQLRLDGAADPRLAQFLHYYPQGPQTPEPGAACSGGVGSPQ